MTSKKLDLLIIKIKMCFLRSDPMFFSKKKTHIMLGQLIMKVL